MAILGCDVALGWLGNIYQAVIDACVRTLHAGGYNICLTVPNLEENRCELPPWKVDGAIVLQEYSPETIEAMERVNLPYVVINGIGGSCCSSVIPDDIGATKRALCHVEEHLRNLYSIMGLRPLQKS